MFVTRLCLTALTADLWALEQPLVWLEGDARITVPKGFITDLASIPRILRNLPLLDVDGVSRRPAALHDWLYAGMRKEGKSFADDTLYAALVAEGMSHPGAWVYYAAVHYFGKGSYAFDAKRHPYAAAGESNLESCDFATEADYQAWIATGAVPNEGDEHPRT